MSNYLNHLMAKSLNQVEAIQPRLHSRFEPVSPLSFSPVVTAEELLSHQDSSIETTNQTQTPKLKTQPERFSSDVDSSSEDEKSKDNSARLQPRQGQLPANSHIEIPPNKRQVIPKQSEQHQASSLTDVPLNPSSKSDPQESSSSPKQPLSPRSDDHSGASNHPATNSPSLQVNSDTELAKQIISPSTSSLLAEERTNITASSTKPSSSLQPITKENSVNSLSQTSPLQPIKNDVAMNPPSSQPTATPTIQVNIGRIEIRATQPQPSKPKTRPKSATLSLDEYLQQRAKGAR